jgi:POT family proton-dependent oligopeptide transporter
VTEAAPALTGGASRQTFLGHPRGLATLFFTEMWERFSYYGTRALLTLYMTAGAGQGGLAINTERAGAIYGLYAAGVYLFSLPGGWLADRLLGQRQSVFWGGVLICCGNLVLALPGGLPLFYLGLLTIAVGTGLLKPNVSCMVGALYGGESGSRRDAGFSIFYLGINLGAFIAPFVAGTIGETMGFRWGFLAAGLAMVLGLIQYRATSAQLGSVGLRVQNPEAPQTRRDVQTLLGGLLAFAAAVALLASGRMQVDVVTLGQVAGVAMVALAVVFFGSVLVLGRLDAQEKRRVVVIALLAGCSTLFWAGYEQAGSTLNLFARDYTDRSFWGSAFQAGQHPASWYQALPPVFVLVGAPLFAWLWVALSKRSRDPSAPAKFGWGLVQLALGFAVMAAAAQLVLASGHRVQPTWLLLTYLLHTGGELCLSPIGLSNVTRLAPARYVGQMMGIWFLGTAIGNLAAGLLGGEVGAGRLADMPHSFAEMAVIGGAGGLVMLLIARPVYRWMQNKE